MVVVASMWELGWNTPIKELDLWKFPMRDLGVDKLYMSPVTNIHSKKVIERDSIQDVIDEHPNLQVVWVTETGDTSLETFEHPENCLYITGRTNYSPFLNYSREGDITLRVPTVINKGLLWGHQAMSIVLYDRFIKNASNNNR